MADDSKKAKKRKWKEVSIDNPAFFSSNLDGFVSLEECKDYSLEFDDSSRVWKFNEGSPEKKPKKDNEQAKNKKKRKKKKSKNADAGKVANEEELNDAKAEVNADKQTEKVDLSDWEGLGVSSDILKALGDQGFTTPTAIQCLAIPPAIQHHRDIIGAAETGSGKTLAFGIPIIHHIMTSKNHKETKTDEASKDDDTPDDNHGDDDGNIGDSDNDVTCSDKKQKGTTCKDTVSKPLKALIMTPTRELALQIRDHLVAAVKYTPIKVAAIVGGMAAQKQQRILKQHPEIVVATPGRLWELISCNEDHVSNLGSLRYLVIDEADRMVEQGHYQELSSILDYIHLKKSEDTFDSCFPEDDKKTKKTPPSLRLQKFIFSATLTLPKSFKKRGKETTVSREELLVSLMGKMNMDRKKSKVVDVTTKKGTVETLTEAKITCTKEEKDCYLYYFLMKYPGRTLVFTNTIDCIRRLASILRLLQLNPLPLHANMQQRQRLKNLDRFKSSERGLLIATDVVARGLDIPKVQHVIHYQVPKDPEVYIHRSGRTARASHEGLSVVLVGPDDLVSYRKITKTLNNGEELESMPVEVSYLADIKDRLSLARQIDKEENKVKKKKSSNDWLLSSAKAMDIEIDQDLLEDIGDTREQKQQQKKLEQMKASLKSMVKAPVLPKGFSGKYPTQSGKLVVPGLQNEQSSQPHAAKAAVEKAKKRKKKK